MANFQECDQKKSFKVKFLRVEKALLIVWVGLLADIGKTYVFYEEIIDPELFLEGDFSQ